MDTNLDAFAARLRRRQVVGARATALETVLVLRQYIAKAKFSTMDQLIEKIKETGKKLQDSQPMELTVGNTIRKILHHIREEYITAAKLLGTTTTSFSLSSFVVAGRPKEQMRSHVSESRSLSRSSSVDGGVGLAETLKPVLMEAIQDVMDELETVYRNVAEKAKDHIHSDEIILTLGRSKTVEAFLKAAYHSRKFSVIVAETAPSYSGKAMAKSLSSVGIPTFLVPDSSIYALMTRVSKVILGAHAVLANGGMYAISGSLLAATAARAHNTPVMVCTGQFKFTPVWNLYHKYGAMDFANPNNVLGFNEGDLVGKLEVLNPNWDYVQPALIDVFVTNDGDHPPSSVYRLIKDAYDDEDHEL